MKVIINADDLGLSIATNKAIECAIVKNMISSCTIIANGMAFDDAIRISKQFTNISYGVHLNIIEFCPMTNSQIFNKYFLTDYQGNFIEGAVFVIKEYPEELKNAIYDEWMSQINKIKNTGITITHIDSHQHTHGIFALKEILIRVISDSGITKVRRKPFMSMYAMLLLKNCNHEVVIKQNAAIKTSKSTFLIRRLKQIKDTFKHYCWMHQLRKSATFTDGFMSYGSFIFLYSRYYRWFRFNTIELMCHPGLKDYDHEMDYVLANELSKYIDYTLISYREL